LPAKFIKSTIALLLFSIIVISIQCAGPLKFKDQAKLGQSVYKQIQTSSLPWKTVARSVENREIYLLELGDGDSTTIIFGGFHGDEIMGVQLVFRFAQYLFFEKTNELEAKVVIIPVLNPDGLVRAKRKNADKVDINRNFPTKSWKPEYASKRHYPGNAPASEPETQVAITIIEEYRPQRIISVHTALEMVNYDGPALSLARKMAQYNSYPVESDIGYETPGSFGTYAGKERNIPTITLELAKESFETVWLTNRDALWTAVGYD
jgi:protein MpaA